MPIDFKSIIKKVSSLGGGAGRAVPEVDAAPTDGFYGRNVRLENARSEWRKIEERNELARLKIQIAADKKIERSKFWTDNGGMFVPTNQLGQQQMQDPNNPYAQKKKKLFGLETGMFGRQSI